MRIRFEDVSFKYTNTPNERNVLDSLTFELNPEDIVGIIGASGSGKTTLIQHFTGLLEPSSGRVLIDDEESGRVGIDPASMRNRIGIVFQFPENQLFEETVFDDVAFGPRNMGLGESEIQQRVEESLDLVGLSVKEFGTRSPFHLSEGEKRRVAIAGVIAMNPDMLVLDEPTACLDPRGVKIIEDILKGLHRLGKQIVIVSHHMDFIIRLCNRLIVLQNGKIVYDGGKGDIFEKTDLMMRANILIPRLMQVVKRLNDFEVIKKSDVYSANELKTLLID